MDIRVVDGDIARQSVPAVVVNLFQGVTAPGGATGAVDAALDGAISRLIADGEIRGKRGEMTLVHTLGKIAPARVLVAGLGRKSDFTQETVRDVTAQACRRLREAGVSTAATIVHGAGVGGMDAGASGQAVAEGALLGLYRFDKYKSRSDDAPALDDLVIVEFDEDKVSEIQTGVRKGTLLAEAANLCRDMVNEPANQMSPTRMSEIARDVAAEFGLEIDVLEENRMRELGMGALLGVAQGSVEPPKLIVLDYRGDPDDDLEQSGADRQGHHVRQRRNLDQARRQHGRDEGRHGGRRLRHRGDQGDQRAGPQDQRDRHGRRYGKHAGRACAASRRRRDRHERQDDRDRQHGR